MSKFEQPCAAAWLRHPMIMVTVLALYAQHLHASEFDNAGGVYTLTALPDPVSEAKRMDRMQLSDQQPAGREVRRAKSWSSASKAGPQAMRLLPALDFYPCGR